jgi:hypothetical protein
LLKQPTDQNLFINWNKIEKSKRCHSHEPIALVPFRDITAIVVQLKNLPELVNELVLRTCDDVSGQEPNSATFYAVSDPVARNCFLYSVIKVDKDKLKANQVAWQSVNTAHAVRFTRSSIRTVVQANNFTITDVEIHGTVSLSQAAEAGPNFTQLSSP